MPNRWPVAGQEDFAPAVVLSILPGALGGYYRSPEVLGLAGHWGVAVNGSF
jgi:hypothetical protein